MMALVALAALLGAAAAAPATEVPQLYADANPYNLAPRDGVDPKFDCAWRRAAYTYGKTLQPKMTAAHQTQLSDALALGACPGGAPEPDLGAPTEEERTTFAIPEGSTAIYVDPADGADSLLAALERSRATEGAVTLALLPGVHRITEPMLLTPKDNNLTIQSFGAGETVLSGAKTLSAAGLTWEKADAQWLVGKNASNIWKAKIPASAGIDSVVGLRLNSARGQRARFPNANSETDQFPTGWVGGNGADGLAWAPVMHGPAPEQNIQVNSPNRSFCMSEFEFYEEGKGGCCAGFTPSEGYWCSDKTSGGGAFTYRIPSGITIGSRNHAKLLPNSPYKDAKGAVFQAWRPGHWASWM
jgi:hypothetical protein